MASSRRRKKRAVNWLPVIIVMLAASFVLGLFYSPITAVRNLRIVGVQPHDRNRVTQLAQSLEGVPYGRVDVLAFESSVLRGRDIYDADLSHNVFGSGVLRLKYRRPIAAVQGAGLSRIYLDDRGVLFSSPEPFQGLRKLILDATFKQPILAFGQAWPCAVVSDFCLKLNSFAELSDAVVHLSANGRLTLSKENFGSVDFGGTDAIDAKLKKLRQLLDEQPDILTRVRSLTLVDPETPAFEPKG
jgi:hypothetical protein